MQVIHSDKHRLHDPRQFLLGGAIAPCPEVPERAERFLAAVTRAGHSLSGPEPQGLAPLAAVHAPDYLAFLQDGYAAWSALPHTAAEILPNVHPGRHMNSRPSHIVGQAGWYMADTACPIAAGTWDAASASADVALTAADLLLDGADHAYALCRPPGHHAFSDMAGGFCFLNNVAIAARRLQRRFPRLVILDIDVHHGNGTQQIFYRSPDVFFVSLHGDPDGFYPFFAGHAHERGADAGDGYTLNLPLPAGTGDEAYLASLDTALAAIGRFGPDALLVSLGLDAQENDPLGILSITTDGFERIARKIATLAVPTLLVQEGGYLCEELADNLARFLSGYSAARGV